MQWDVTGSLLSAGIAFVAGIAVGWLLATTRAKGKWHISLSPADSGSGPRALRVRTKIYKMEIKCLCGALLKFRDPVEPGYQPYPNGDSVTCPSCGRIKDLHQIRALENDVNA